MSKIKGFYNNGNTCYMNASLQMFFHNNDFCKLIILNREKSDKLLLLANMIKDYYTTSDIAINPNEIKTIFNNKMFSSSEQQDAGEFIIYFLDILHDELKDNLNMLFEVKIETSVKCKFLKCLKVSQTIEKNNYLLLPIINNSDHLDDCYKQYKLYEKLENDNMYYCNNCKDKRIASKRVNITDWSKHLIIILKRFHNDGHKITKNNNIIEIPLEWRHDYVLKSAIIHIGNMNSGHYIYITKENDSWFLCDDTKVVEIKDVNKLLNHGYIFYYMKKIE
jgi:ubiquitin C-terminal hydrolase